MTNSDYLLKAAVKKVTEKLNDILVEKIEEVTSIAQDAPEIIKKEIDTLKEEIIEEASRMAREESKNKDSNDSKSTQESNFSGVLKEIEEIKEKIEQFNLKMNNTL